MKWVVRAAVLVFLSAMSSTALADEEAEAQAEPARGPTLETRRWYGWQTLMLDGAAMVMTVGAGHMGGSGNDDSTAQVLGVSALAVYVLGGPIVHGANDHWGKAAGSLAMRVAAPAALGALFYYGSEALTDCESAMFGCGLMGLFGGVLGVAGAIAVDSAVIARERVPAPPPNQWVSLAPSVAPRREGGMTFGLSGTF